MKIYCKSDNKSITLQRVVSQVKDTMPPDYESAAGLSDADIVVVPVIGQEDATPYLDYGVPTVVLQLCYLTAGGDEKYWQSVWNRSLMVGSYYHLPVETSKFIRFPLGFNPKVFHGSKDKTFRMFDAIVTGWLDGPEEIISVKAAFGEVAHVGHDFQLGSGYHNFQNITDAELRRLYQMSTYVIGLRRVEGFELPIIEGGASGCIPITFDKEHYRHWFSGKAIFIKEDDHTTRHLQLIAESKPAIWRLDKDWTPFEQNNAWRPFWTKLGEVYEEESKVVGDIDDD